MSGRTVHVHDVRGSPVRGVGNAFKEAGRDGNCRAHPTKSRFTLSRIALRGNGLQESAVDPLQTCELFYQQDQFSPLGLEIGPKPRH
jgi:hypothetical protein